MGWPLSFFRVSDTRGERIRPREMHDEDWHLEDNLTLFKQLGVVKP
jgi:hypothetical protein